MGDQSGFAELVAELKTTREQVMTADAERVKVIEELRGDILKGSKSLGDTEGKLVRIVTDIATHETKMQAMQDSMNNLIRKMTRSGGPNTTDGAVDERKHAIDLLELKHQWKVPKQDPEHPFQPTEDQITEAITANKAVRALMHTTDVAMLSPEYRKSLSSFSMGASGFILPPEISNKILSCLVYPTDVSGLCGNLTVSGPSIKFLVDNVLLDTAAWACETTCFANNPQTHLTDGLGELEIKPETLRYIICTTRDLLEDAATNIEAWMVSKVQRAFGLTISNAIVSGTGVGMPTGILNPNTNIPICDTSANTPTGTFTWQDLVMLKWQVPMSFVGGGSYWMNQYTMGQALTLSDSMGRPILLADPTEAGTFMIAGSPVQIVTQMPNVAAGSLPVAFGNWKEVYMVINRKAVTMMQDPYSAGFCVLFKFEARVGGAVICSNAARLLRIH
jgi:HK97 family phage major capsid protein